MTLTLLFRHLARRTLAMPADANAAGDIFGGWLLSQMDIAGATVAVERSGGRVVILGVLPAWKKVQIEPFDLLFREVQFLSSIINPFTQDRAAAMIATGRIRVAPLISRTLPLEDALDAILNPPRRGEIRALVLPNG
mgnify:CR=1 FL=1